MPIMEISVIPLGTETASVSKYVAESIKALKENKDVKYNLTPMGTIIEADSIERLFTIATKMHHAVLNKDINRVITAIKIDDRKDKQLTTNHKLKSVQEKL